VSDWRSVLIFSDRVETVLKAQALIQRAAQGDKLGID